jgi:hypothetical protein
MKCISEIRKIIIDLKQEINDEIKAEDIAGGFDDDWVKEMHLRHDILGELNKIVASYEFIIEQENQ